MKFRLTLFTLLISLPVVSLALTENDFAYVADVETDAGKPFYELEIPAVVYERISRSDLGDLRVLNASGQVVPHGLRLARDEKTSQTETQDVPFFPLYQQAGKLPDDLHINIQRNADGEVIDIRSRPDEGETNRLAGYLLDLRKWKQPIDLLTLNWKSSADADFIRKLTVSSSQDLTRWHVIASGRPLVNLSYQGHQLTDNNIQLSTGTTKYLRLIFDDQQPGLRLESIQVANTRSSQQQKQNWLQATVTANKTPGEFEFEHDSKNLVRQLRIELPENNTVVRLKVLSRPNGDSPWRLRGSSLLYRLSVDGVDIKQTKLPVTASRDRHWILLFDQQGGGLGSGLPQVELAWQPQNLVFVARGQAPYRVVWGSARVKPVLKNASQILVGMSSDGEASGSNGLGMLGEARWLLDSVRPVNKQVLEPEEEPINWRQWVLWIVLSMAAMILIGMAVRLMKKMGE